EGVTLLSATSSQGSLQRVQQLVEAHPGNLAVGASATVTVIVIPQAAGAFANRVRIKPGFQNNLGTPTDVTVTSTAIVPLHNTVTGAVVTVAPAPGANLVDAHAVAGQLPIGLSTGVTLPVGLFQLSLNQLDPSQPTLVTFDLPAGVTANTYYKY